MRRRTGAAFPFDGAPSGTQAFLFDAERRLLTLPMAVTGDDHDAVCTAESASHWRPWRHALWQGALTWNVTERGFELLGAVSHLVETAQDGISWQGGQDANAADSQ